MSAKTVGEAGLHKTWNKTRILLVLLIFGAIIFSAMPAQAAGTPSKVIAFTDKKVYTAWWMSAKTTTPAFNKLDDEGQTILLYAFVLDDDGNIMKGRTVQVTLNDTDFDHFQKADWTIHTTMVGNNTYFTNTKNLNDTGTFGDAISNDGLYTTTIAMPSNLLTDVQTAPRMDDQIRVKIDVKDIASGLNTTTYVLVSWGKCHQAGTTSHPAHVTTTASDLCTNCHGGYEHFFENVSRTIPDAYLDVHFQKLGDSLPDSTEVVKGMQAYNWNSTQFGGDAPYGSSASWKLRSGGGAVYCRFCHKDPAASNWFDYGSGDRANMADKPSCGQGTSGYSGNCHSTTDIEGAPVLNWTQNAAISNTNDTLAGINKQMAHNHSTRGANVTCTLCHNGPHGLSRPNPATMNLTLICQTCHNRSDGWINNTRYNENISHPVGSACKNCHVNNNILDTHKVPTGVFGGRWCLDCHRINGKSPIYIDENVVNISNADYIHSNLNNKSDATNASRICWACHVNDTLVQNNIVNSTGIPVSTHPVNYTSPRKCLDCHNKSTGINFSAPQPQRHTWWAPTMKTSAVTYCTNCHAQGESLESYNQTATTPSTDNESVSHYGKERLDMEALIGQKAYCAYCHQNETTVYGPFAKESNKVRSDHASQNTTPSCGNSTCHRQGALHDSNLVKPNFTESNISSTCLNCHNSTNYNYHNSTLTCWDCHMNGTAGSIHPIQFVQYNGNFTGAKLTGATCYDCHKTNNVDNTTQRLASTTPPKIYDQAHSNDPMNGTKWGDYWKYTPTVYQFANYELLGGNGSIAPSHPFSNIEGPSNDYMQLNETQIGRIFVSIFPSEQGDREFTTSQGSWTGAIVVDPAPVTISGIYDGTVGNPAGSLKVTDTDSTANNQYSWTSPGFYYNGTGAIFKYANFSMDRRRSANDGTTRTIVTLVRPVSGSVAIYDSTAQTGTDAGFTAISVADISPYLADNGTYQIIINTTYVASGGAGPSTTYYDNVKIMIKEKVWNRYEMVINTTGVPVNGSSMIGMAYQVHKENTSLMIYNKTTSAYELLDTLDKSVFYDYTKNISSTHHINSTDGITGNVSVKFVDNDQSDTDAVSDAMHIRYLYVYTDRGLQYPCEQCHSPNKHYVNPTLGSPSKFNASNKVNQSISSTGTWCQQCHWQGAANYSLMILEFNQTRNPPENVPPEITGNATYGNYPTGARDSTPYKDHTGFDLSDAGCFACHGGSLNQNAGMTAFVHGVSEGVSGGANCTNCHNAGQTSPKVGALVNISAMNDSLAIHRNLNSGATSPSGYPAENKKCWACHGNGSEPAAGNHPSKYNKPYNCTECHVQGAGQNLNFTPKNNLLNVTQHYWNGTNISTSANSCYSCHNRSEMMVGLALDPDGVDTNIYGGANGGNNSTSHYGKKRSDMAALGNTTYCNYCHNNQSSVFPFLNDTNNRTIANHSMSYPNTNPACSDCHSSGRLHNSTVYKTAFTLPNSSYCLSCHGSGGSATIKNLEQHNGTTGLNCSQCHLNSTKSIHPARYLQQDSTWSTSKTGAVNCTTCHQSPGFSGFNAAPMTPKPMNHSTNTYSGALWNNTQPAYWTNTSQQSSCDYCHGKIALHNTSGLGNITRVKGTNTVRQNLSTSRWCANCHYAGASGYAGTSFSPEPPEILNASGKVPSKARDNANFYNHSQDMATGYNDTKCKSCHDNALDVAATSLNFSHNLAPGGGGANCTGCHYIGAGVQNVNVTAMNDASSIHTNLNKGATASDNGYNDSKKCWACHGNGQEPSGHPTRYKTPYNCIDCHVQGGQNFNYTPNTTILNVTQHYWNGTSIKTPSASTCYICHNTSGMIISASDPDGASSNVYGGANGGDLSVSHYGIKRGDLASQQNTTAYCNNCHNGASSFPFIDNANRTIFNHSLNYPASNPTCRDCHGSERIHNTTLYKPSLSPLPNATYCTNCHGSGGSATIKNLERHNSTGTACSSCHLNASDSIHPVRYLQQDNTWATTNTSAVNCTNCHQGAGMSNFSSAPKVPLLNHSTNAYSGALWNGTQVRFWNNASQQSSCDYCHGKFALHNLSGLGNITLIKGNNTVRQSLGNGYWCANCHYNRTPAGNYSYKGSLFNPEPPEVLNRSGKVPSVARDGSQFYNHSNDIASSYDDAKCKTCHDNALGAGTTSLNFTHSLGSSSGGANCTACHGLGGSLADGKRINQTAMNSSLGIHKDLNRNAQVSDVNYSENRKCWACHGSGEEPSGHPSNYKTPFKCTDCHLIAGGQNLNYNPNNTLLNVTQHYWNGTSINTSAAGNCYICHNKTEMMLGMTLDPDNGSAAVYGGANGGNASVSHYGKKRGDMAVMSNTTYCNYCHNNASSVFPFANATNNKTIANHSMNYAGTNPECKECHSSGRLHNSTLYKPAFTLSNSTYCLGCHGNNGSGGTNYTGAITGYKEKHNNTICTECHINSSKSIHPVRYLRQDSTWGTANTSAVNCTSCHQGAGISGFGSAPLVQMPLWHSNNTYSGAMWNGSQQARYWDNKSQQSSCDYCHGKIALHNSSGLGNSSIIRGGNLKNQSLTGGYWCANCHYDGKTPSGNYNYKGDSLSPIPPEILNLTGLVPANSSNGISFQNHSVNVAGDWSDARCKSCHGKDQPSDITSAIFVHKLNQSQPEAGGPDCLKCHASTASELNGPPQNRRVNKSAFTNYSAHRNLNNNATNTSVLSDIRSKACWACHGDGIEPVKHPTGYMNTKSCDYCHVNNNFNATRVYQHYPGSVFAGTVVYDSSDPGRTCISCHNNSLATSLNLSYDTYDATKLKNATVSHYAVNRTLGESIELSGAVTVALPNTRNTTGSFGCNQCHSVGGADGIYGPDYGNARAIPSTHNKMGITGVSCQLSCHNSNPAANVTLHGSSVGMYLGTNGCYSSGCHSLPSTSGSGGRRRR